MTPLTSLAAVSPRTLRRIHRLPKANDEESRKIELIQKKFEVDSKSGEFRKINNAGNQRTGLYGKILDASYRLDEKEDKLRSDFTKLTNSDPLNFSEEVGDDKSATTISITTLRKKSHKTHANDNKIANNTHKHNNSNNTQFSDSVSYGSLTKSTASLETLSTLDIISLSKDHGMKQDGLTKNRNYSSLSNFYDPKKLSKMSDFEVRNVMHWKWGRKSWKVN